jgi:asparagine synthase (glutamine-hydrolysing)
MCGIIGAIGKNSFEFVNSNLKFLRDRGPDSGGALALETGLSIGSTRLAMLDPNPRSNQPMVDPRTKNIIAFNGEIYNFQSIKKFLIDKSITFSTESDTEVALKSISHLGIDSIKKFEGMFAFAFYDSLENTLILARDYLGKKPLYYSIGKNFLVFSSKISLVKKFLKSTSLDEQSLSNYLRLGYVVNPNTMFKEIKSVEPGEIIKIDLNKFQTNLKYNFTPNALLSSANLDLVSTLEEAILQRTFSHNSFALSMSGGIDSTIIAILSAKMGLNCKTYSVRWSDTDKSRYNEDSRAAELISKSLGLEFTSVEVPNIKNLSIELDNFIKVMEEPNSNPSGLSMMALYNQIKNDGHRLVLTGDGSDEVFAGYYRYNKINQLEGFPSLLPNKFNFLDINRNLNNQILKNIALALLSANKIDFWLYWQQIASQSFLTNFYKQYKKPNFDIHYDSFIEFVRKKNSKVAITMIRDLKIWLSMESNTKLDRVSMAHSIEARSPFQSEQIIGLGFNNLLKSDFSLLSKQILIRRFPQLDYLPINKSKMGFISPLGHWLRNNKDLIRESSEYIKYNFDFNKSEIDRLVNSPENGSYKEFSFLWALIVLAKWHCYAHN